MYLGITCSGLVFSDENSLDLRVAAFHVPCRQAHTDATVVVLVAGCKSACNRHGTCALEDGEYHCVCSDGWAGLDCSIRLEMECNDEIDNDEGEDQCN
jgi:EGF-like domain.